MYNKMKRNFYHNPPFAGYPTRYNGPVQQRNKYVEGSNHQGFDQNRLEPVTKWNGNVKKERQYKPRYKAVGWPGSSNDSRDRNPMDFTYLFPEEVQMMATYNTLLSTGQVPGHFHGGRMDGRSHELYPRNKYQHGSNYKKINTPRAPAYHLTKEVIESASSEHALMDICDKLNYSLYDSQSKPGARRSHYRSDFVMSDPDSDSISESCESEDTGCNSDGAGNMICGLNSEIYKNMNSKGRLLLLGTMPIPPRGYEYRPLVLDGANIMIHYNSTTYDLRIIYDFVKELLLCEYGAFYAPEIVVVLPGWLGMKYEALLAKNPNGADFYKLDKGVFRKMLERETDPKSKPRGIAFANRKTHGTSKIRSNPISSEVVDGKDNAHYYKELKYAGLLAIAPCAHELSNEYLQYDYERYEKKPKLVRRLADQQVVEVSPWIQQYNRILKDPTVVETTHKASLEFGPHEHLAVPDNKPPIYGTANQDCVTEFTSQSKWTYDDLLVWREAYSSSGIILRWADRYSDITCPVMKQYCMNNMLRVFAAPNCPLRIVLQKDYHIMKNFLFRAIKQ